MTERTSVMFFCLGNICRSPLAEGLFKYHLEERGLIEGFHVESSGTSSYHVGELPDPGSRRVIKARLGVDISDQRSQQLTTYHIESFDYLVAMDRSNQRNALQLGTAEILLLRDFERDISLRDSDVPDPWGGGGSMFDEVFDIVYRCTEEFLDHVLAQSK